MKTELFDKAVELSNQYINNQTAIDFSIFNKQFFSSLKVLFIQNFSKNIKQINLDILKRIDNDLHISNTTDPEIKQSWFTLSIKLHYEEIFYKIVEFVSEQGRMKYLDPIYEAWADNGYIELAKQTFQSNLKFYHPLAIKGLQTLFDKHKPKRRLYI